MVQTKPCTKNLNANVGENIGLSLGAEMISSYRQQNAADVVSYFVGRNVIEEILTQPGCVGINFYNAYNETGEKTLVYVGVNSQGKDMLQLSYVNNAGDLNQTPAIVADRIIVMDVIETDNYWFDL